MQKIAEFGENQFAIVLKKDSAISQNDVTTIINNCNLTPIFLVDNPEAIYSARFMARIFDAPIVKTENYRDFKRAAANLSFSVCESLKPALYSILSGIPAYLDAKDEKGRSFMGKMAKTGCPHGILIPYTKNRLADVKKVGACGSDFGLLLNSIIKNINFKG